MKKSQRMSIQAALLGLCLMFPSHLCQDFQQIQQTNVPINYPNTIYQDDSTFVQAQQVVPATIGSSVGSAAVPQVFPAARGYTNMAAVQDDYYTAPVHAQYWTGSQGPYQQYPAARYGPPVPQQYYGVQPGFHPQYWTGPYYPQPAQPYYAPQGYFTGPKYPQYPQYGQVYPKGQMPYSTYPVHSGVYGAPLPRKPKGGLAKTLLGAAVVGAVAGAVARGK